jgi:hypothetical protein
MAGNYRQHFESFYFYDSVGGGVNPIAAYQPVSLATAAEVATAIATGTIPGGLGVGDIVVPTPITSSLPTRRVVGVTDASAKNGQSVKVVTGGVAEVMVDGALTYNAGDTFIFPTLRETRTSAQTPFTNNYEMLLPMDPSVALTYQLCLCNLTAITPATTGANAQYFPLGYALKGATAKYDIIPVELDLRIIYA